MNCILIEDEPLALSRMREYVGKVPSLTLLAAFDNAGEALEFVQSERPELIFLDIEMTGLSGIGFLESLDYSPLVILTTAFSQYAVKAFELQVTDYLVKPFSFERFQQAVIKALDSQATAGRLMAPAPFLFIKTEYRYQKIVLDDLLFIEGMKDYRRVHCEKEKIMTLETFKELEDRLPASLFCRVHKSWLVALGKIESVEKDRIRIRQAVIPLSETYKEEFYRRIR